MWFCLKLKPHYNKMETKINSKCDFCEEVKPRLNKTSLVNYDTQTQYYVCDECANDIKNI